MKLTSPLLGYLAKAAGSKASTPGTDDTKPQVPGIFLPTLSVPFPCFSLISAPLPGGANIPVNSFIFSQKVVFNVALGEILFQFGPGLWRNELLMYLEEAGAVSDATSTLSVTLNDQLTASTIELMRITNKQGVDHTKRFSFDLLVTADQSYAVSRQRVAGAGTGANIGAVVWSASRLF